MSTLDQRKNAFENKFAFEEEKLFKIRVMACKAFSHWAANEMKFDENAKHEFSKEIIDLSIINKNNDQIITFVQKILNENKIEYKTHYLEKVLQEIYEDCRSKLV